MGLATIFVKINQRSDSIQFKLSLPGGCFIFFPFPNLPKCKIEAISWSVAEHASQYAIMASIRYMLVD